MTGVVESICESDLGIQAVELLSPDYVNVPTRYRGQTENTNGVYTHNCELHTLDKGSNDDASVEASNVSDSLMMYLVSGFALTGAKFIFQRCSICLSKTNNTAA